MSWRKCAWCEGPMPDRIESTGRWGGKRYKRSDAVTCSKACRQAASRARKRAAVPCCKTCGQVLPPELRPKPVETDPAQLKL